jgi:C1A family cysteine protease
MNTRQIKVRNSWGSAWGDKGYFYMPFDFISDANQADDFWTVKL